MKYRRLRSAFAHYFLALGLTGLFAYPGKGASLDREGPGEEGDGDYQIGPEYTIDPDLKDRGNPKGKSFEFSMALADSRFFEAMIPPSSLKRRPCAGRDEFMYTCPPPVETGPKRRFSLSMTVQVSSIWCAMRWITS